MNPNALSRSPMLMNANQTAVVVIDLQTRLLPHIHDGQDVAKNIQRLLSAANTLSVKTVGTEQYPQGLGSTVEPVATQLLSQHDGDRLPEKTMFSCRQCESVFESLQQNNIHNLLLCGIETHVCVQQTALDMIAAGYNVFVAVDAVGSRFTIDHDTAIRRIESSGCHLATTESAIFEWCEDAKHPSFKEISKLIKSKE